MSKDKQESFTDLANYHEMSKPFATSEEADKAVKAFFDEMYEVRKKHNLQDVHVCVRFDVVGSGTYMMDMHAGDDLHIESMLAHAFGRAQSDRQALIARLVAADSIKRRQEK